MTFTIHTDPGHGWIEVPLTIIAKLGIAKDISSYSFTDGRNAYLEEDCDAWVFVQAFEKAHGERPEIVDSYAEFTNIRSLPRFNNRTTQGGDK